MNRNHGNSTSQNDGYEEPISRYTDLRPISENYKRYDVLIDKPTPTKLPQTLTRKSWIIIIVTIVILCQLCCIITFAILYFRSSCASKDCGVGKCYLDTDKNAFCLCPKDRSGENCERMQLSMHQIHSGCPADWISYSSWCYKEYLDKRTWFQSRDFCRSMGTDLLSIHDQDETQFLTANFNVLSRLYWMGLSDLETPKKFTWSDGTNLKYTNWSPGEPNNFNNNEHCVQLSPTYSGQWNDNDCFMSLEFICKTKSAPQCGPGPWFFYNDSCYLFNLPNGSESTASWIHASQLCYKNHADLAIINSKDEYNFILSQATKSTSSVLWIGLNNRKDKGRYEWIDGSLPSFLSWNIGEPNNENHRCVGILSMWGNWDDQNCEDLNGFICEKRLV